VKYRETKKGEWFLLLSRFCVGTAGMVGFAGCVLGVILLSPLFAAAMAAVALGFGFTGLSIRWEALDRSDREFYDLNDPTARRFDD
jgi:hypothetical protein